MTVSGLSANGSSRLAGLDGLRGIAACGVAFGFHAQYLFAAGALPPVWGGPVLHWLHQYGWTLVDLFFVLSGYVFAHVYLAHRSLERPGAVADFAVARFARLYPLHLAMLLYAVLFLAPAPNNTAPTFVAHLVMAQSLVDPVGQTFVGPSWSLSVEAICYVLFVLAVLARGRVLAWLTAAAIAGAAAKLMLDPEPLAGPVNDPLARGLLGFFAGQALWRLRAPLSRVPAPALAALIVAALLVDTGGASAVVPLSLIAWPCAVVLALRTRWLASRPCQWVGERSYAIYLVHMAFIDHFQRLTGGKVPSPAWVVWAHVALIALTVLVADVAYRRFELPARIALRTRYAGWRERAGRTALAASG